MILQNNVNFVVKFYAVAKISQINRGCILIWATIYIFVQQWCMTCE